MDKKKIFIIVGAVIAVLLIGIAACFSLGIIPLGGSNENENNIVENVEKEQMQNIQEEKPLTLTGIDLNSTVENTFYVKSDDLCYPAILGETNILEKEMIPKKTDPRRVVSFCKDEALVPTLYSDDKLIYKTSMTMPSFVWERFYDNGYSFGMFGMQMAASGNAEFILGTSKTNHQSTAYEKLSVMELGDSSIFIDKVNGQKVNEEYLSNGGSVLGLIKNEKYNVDLYIGTKYHNIPMTADTLILNSMKVFQTTEFELSPDGYASITIPENLESGYYMINGLGVFRYVNGPKTNGYDGVDFNYIYVEEEKKK